LVSGAGLPRDVCRHPYYDEVQRQQLDQAFLDDQARRPGRLVTILPGSRTQEVAKNLASFLKAADEIRQRIPDVRFAVASFNEKQAAMAREQVAARELPVDVFAGRTPELIRLARCCLACSGSVSLELLYHAKPTVILYRVGWFPYTVARNLFIKVRFITLVKPVGCRRSVPAPRRQIRSASRFWRRRAVS